MQRTQRTPQILLVEDEEVVSLELSVELGDLGIRVDVHSRAAQAQRAFETKRYDAAIIDIGLPDVRGDVLARHARSRYPRLPILLVTGMRSEEFAAAFADDPLVRVMEKPYDVEQLMATLHEIADGQLGSVDFAMRVERSS